MNLLYLRYFYEVSRSQSFTEAARLLRVSQPALSKMVRQLEDQLGTELLIRRKTGLTLTSDGHVLFSSAAKIFSEVKWVNSKLNSKSHELRGDWCLGASDSLAIHFLPHLIGAFKSKHAKVKISLFSGVSSQIKTELQFDRCQLGMFFNEPTKAEGFDYVKVADTEFWVMISRKFKTKEQKEITISDLKSLKIPRIESRHRDYQEGFVAHFHSKKLGFTDEPWLEVNNHEVKKALCEAGVGFAILTRLTVEDAYKSGTLLRVRTPMKLSAPIYAVWKKQMPLDSISEAFLSDLKSFIQK